MGRRQLPVLSWPLDLHEWRALQCAAAEWVLLPRSPEGLAVALRTPQIVLDLSDSILLRLRWRTDTGWRRLFPIQLHLKLRREQQPGQWALLRANLWASRRHHWLGAP